MVVYNLTKEEEEVSIGEPEEEEVSIGESEEEEIVPEIEKSSRTPSESTVLQNIRESDATKPDISTTPESSKLIKQEESNSISSEALRIWSTWLTKVADKAAYEWQEWLLAHIHLCLSLNELLEEPECEVLENNSEVHTCRNCSCANSETSEISCDPCGDVDEESDAAKMKNNIMPNESKIIPIPRDKSEMLQIEKEFERRAKKYQSLYKYWSVTSDRVIEDILGKSATEQVYTHEEIPYLRDVDIGIESDDEEIRRSVPTREKITCNNIHLFFNLTDEPDEIESSSSRISLSDTDNLR